MLKKTDASDTSEAVVVKKYANRRLYNTETSTYVTLEDLSEMVRKNRDFLVYDAKSGDDLTHTVLTQIIVEQELRAGGQNLLPVPFLRQLIRFYDDALGKMVPGYLQFSLEALAKENEKFRSRMASAFGNPGVVLEVYQEQTRKNLEIFEQAMSMWASFSPGQVPTPPGMPPAQQASAPGAEQSKSASGDAKASNGAGAAPQEAPGQEQADLVALKAELARMAEKIEQLTKAK